MKSEQLNWQDVTEGKTDQRVKLASATLAKLCDEDLSKARLEECSDEKTGRRYGQAKTRRGKSVKIGGGGRNRGSNYAYQVWLVWN